MLWKNHWRQKKKILFSFSFLRWINSRYQCHLSFSQNYQNPVPYCIRTHPVDHMVVFIFTSSFVLIILIVWSSRRFFLELIISICTWHLNLWWNFSWQQALKKKQKENLFFSSFRSTISKNRKKNRIWSIDRNF